MHSLSLLQSMPEVGSVLGDTHAFTALQAATTNSMSLHVTWPTCTQGHAIVLLCMVMPCLHEKRYNEQCGHFALMHVEGFVFPLSKALVQRHTSDIGMVTNLTDCYNT